MSEIGFLPWLLRRYRKFTCLLKVATNNELFKQQGIDNKVRIIHLRQLLTDDTRPKCHASLSDIEALYDEMDGINEVGRQDLSPEVPIRRNTDHS